MRTYTYTVSPNQKLERIDSYLCRFMEHTSRSRIQQLIDNNLVKVGNKPVSKSHKVKPGETIEVCLPLPAKVDAGPEDIPLTIVFEDDDLLIVNKEAGMVVHPAYTHSSGTLVNALLHHIGDLSEVNGKLRPGIVHRLDKDTSGLLLVAKNDQSHRFLAAQFSKHSIERTYWSVIWGKLKQSKGTIDAPIARSTRDRKRFAVGSLGKSAVTHYEVLEVFEYSSLVKLNLETGRTHQIRVHMSHIGHPVMGDPTYDGTNANRAGSVHNRHIRARDVLKVIGRQALHAKTLGFVHPASREQVNFDSEIPGDMQALLQLLKA